MKNNISNCIFYDINKITIFFLIINIKKKIYIVK